MTASVICFTDNKSVIHLSFPFWTHAWVFIYFDKYTFEIGLRDFVFLPLNPCPVRIFHGCLKKMTTFFFYGCPSWSYMSFPSSLPPPPLNSSVSEVIPETLLRGVRKCKFFLSHARFFFFSHNGVKRQKKNLTLNHFKDLSNLFYRFAGLQIILTIWRSFENPGVSGTVFIGPPLRVFGPHSKCLKVLAAVSSASHNKLPKSTQWVLGNFWGSHQRVFWGFPTVSARRFREMVVKASEVHATEFGGTHFWSKFPW